MTANFSTKNAMNYVNVKLVRDAKHFPKKGDIPAATYITFAHNTKGQDATIFVDARILRGSELMSNLRKGDIVNSVRGELNFKVDNQGNIRGVINDANAETLVQLKDRAPLESAEAGGGLTDVATDLGAPAFD